MAKVIKRSKGVIILAIILLIGHLPFRSEASAHDYALYFGNLSSFFLFVDLVSNVAGMTIAIGLFFLKDIIRKAVVVLNVILIPEAIMRSVIAYPRITNSISGPEMLRHQAITTYASVVTIGLCILYIYFFTRPKVKEQFK